MAVAVGYCTKAWASPAFGRVASVVKRAPLREFRRGSVQGSTLSDVMPREKDSWRPVGGPNPTKISRDRVVP
jgi:hypothetical protein